MEPIPWQLLERVPDLTEWSRSQVLSSALSQFYAFSLVFVRMSGLMLIGPILGQSAVPAQVRVLLVVASALLITPTLRYQAQHEFARWDRNQDGQLEKREIPAVLHARFESLNRQLGKPLDSNIRRSEWPSRGHVPSSLIAYGILAIRELAFGFVLGLGLAIVFSGLQLAGELIDQQTGIGLSGIVNPSLDMNTGISGQALYLFGLVVFLTMPPVQGHLLVVSALLDTFQAIPIGEGWISRPSVELLSDLVHQSLVLGIQVAAPVLIAMALTGLTMGFLGHTVPQINVLNLGFPIRALINVFLLSLSLSGAARILIDLLPAVIARLRFTLVGY